MQMRHAEAVLIQLTEVGQGIAFLASILHERLDSQRPLQRAAASLLAALCVRDEAKVQAVQPRICRSLPPSARMHS